MLGRSHQLARFSIETTEGKLHCLLKRLTYSGLCRAKWQAKPKEFIALPFDALAGREDISDRLGQITAPAIVFHGEADVAIAMEKAEQLQKELPGCEELVRIPGAGHASNVSHPAEVNGPLLDFLRTHR